MFWRNDETVSFSRSDNFTKEDFDTRNPVLGFGPFSRFLNGSNFSSRVGSGDFIIGFGGVSVESSDTNV